MKQDGLMYPGVGWQLCDFS